MHAQTVSSIVDRLEVMLDFTLDKIGKGKKTYYFQ